MEIRKAFSGIVVFVCLNAAAAEPQTSSLTFPFKTNDRVAWIGSSSTAIGKYCVAMEFLLRTRHPELNLTFMRQGNPANGTFATCFDGLPKWLSDFKPTIVFFQYGGNDTRKGDAGLDEMRANMVKCYDKVKSTNANIFFITPQAVDAKKEPEMAKIFDTYVENMLAFGKEKNWQMVDTHRPLDVFYRSVQKDNPAFVFTEYHSHLCAPGYMAWGFIQYDLLNPPAAVSSAEIDASGKVIATTKCKISDVNASSESLSFTRSDEILPIMPASDLPMRQYAPLEKCSKYMLTVSGLPDGKYDVLCESKPVGTCDAKALAAGVNLNTLLLDSKKPAPWAAFADEIYKACAHKLLISSSDQKSDPFTKIGSTHWRFEIRKSGVGDKQAMR
jgi:hypothetical protein